MDAFDIHHSNTKVTKNFSLSDYKILIIFSLIFFRTIGYFTKEDKFRWDHLIPLSLPLAMFYFGQSDIILVLKHWVVIIGMCSFMTGVIGLNAGHHHPDVAHEGDQLE